jgi:hypothetical protein
MQEIVEMLLRKVGGLLEVLEKECVRFGGAGMNNGGIR